MGQKQILQSLTGRCAYLALLCLIGCGYQFAGRSDLFPKDIHSVYVEPFLNRTRDVGLGTEITTALRGELYRRGELQLVDEPGRADAILSGVVRSFDSLTASVNQDAEVLQFEATLIVDTTFRRREPSEILWRGQGIRLSEIYAGERAAVVTTSSKFQNQTTLSTTNVRSLTDIQLTETESRRMREELMERFARELHQRLMEMF
ncbi:MAG TPA: LptE family protein [Candidatus Binatia bacterium]|jgi:Lipopolysaccharide-assembly|nr:LptE family protein [Candidatus Binatia bacterium]